jgi:hypothetical protein
MNIVVAAMVKVKAGGDVDGRWMGWWWLVLNNAGSALVMRESERVVR